MDRAKCRKVKEVALKAMQDALKDMGISVAYATGGSFNPTELTIKVLFTEGKVLSAEEKAAQDFLTNCHHIGLKPTDLNRMALIRNGTKLEPMAVCGLLPKGRDNIILVRTEKGTSYRVPLDVVQRGFELYDNQNKKKTLDQPKPSGKRPDADILSDIRRVMLDLEPENLTADGERPAAFVASEKKRLEGELNVLYTELGRKPSDSEIWNV